MIGSFITNFIGASIRWCFGKIRAVVFGGKSFSFEEYLNGPNNAEGIIDTAGHGCVNHVIGILVGFILGICLIKLIGSFL